jgi:Tfp pilus assembly protein PilF
MGWRAVQIVLPALCASLLAQASGQGEARLRQLPLPVRAVLSRIGPLLDDQDYVRALEMLQTFQAREGVAPAPGSPDPKGYHHPEIYFALGNCHLLQGSLPQAAAAYRQAVARDPRHTSAWLNLAKTSYETEQYADAGRCFWQGYDSAGQNNPEHLYFAAASYLMAHEPDRSIELFLILLDRHAGAIRPQWRESLVSALLEADRPKDALVHIEKLILAYSGKKRIQWQEILLYQYLNSGMERKALDLARSLTLESPAQAKWWKALIQIQLHAGMEKEALASLIVVGFIQPLSREENKLLADLSLRLNVPILATPAYEACLKEKPSKQVLERLVMAYRQLGLPGKALARLEADPATERDPDLLLLQGQMLYELKRFAQAARVFRRAADQDGEQRGRAWLMAGYAAWQTDELSQSRRAFTRAAAYSREKPAATEALKQLALASRVARLAAGNSQDRISQEGGAR